MSGNQSELDVSANRRVGSVLRGKYRLDRVLGIGGMAVVYKATHRNQAEFAVKMLHPELSVREDVRTRFLREGYAANSVKHPGAVLVVNDDVAEDGAAFLVMELLDGEGVESVWERSNSRVPVRGAIAIVHQLLDVLAAAHAKGIVHRDIKPANVFATRDGTLKVLDFGIARARDAAAGASNATGTGILLGTPAFMAPEQAMGQTSLIDGQTDVWAAGATLFALLGGTYVHQGENAAQLMIFAATRPARSLATVAPDVPPAIVEIVDRALAFEKTARWPSAAAMRDALEVASRATFGEGPSKAALAAILKTSEAAYAPTAYFEAPSVPEPAPRGSVPGARPSDANGPSRTPEPASRLPAPRAGLSTTAKPVVSTAPPEFLSDRVPGLEPRRRGLVAVAIAGTLLLLGGGGLAARSSGRAVDASNATQGPPPSVVQNAPDPVMVPLTQATAPSASSEGAPAGRAGAVQTSTGPNGVSSSGARGTRGSSGSVGSHDHGGVAGAPGNPGPGGNGAAGGAGGGPPGGGGVGLGGGLGLPVPAIGLGGGSPVSGGAAIAAPVIGSPAPPIPAPQAAAAATAPPAASARPKPNCNPNYTFDANGNKHFKPECF